MEGEKWSKKDRLTTTTTKQKNTKMETERKRNERRQISCGSFCNDTNFFPQYFPCYFIYPWMLFGSRWVSSLLLLLPAILISIEN